jgi:hypothetical protein
MFPQIGQCLPTRFSDIFGSNVRLKAGFTYDTGVDELSFLKFSLQA